MSESHWRGREGEIVYCVWSCEVIACQSVCIGELSQTARWWGFLAVTQHSQPIWLYRIDSCLRAILCNCIAHAFRVCVWECIYIHICVVITGCDVLGSHGMQCILKAGINDAVTTVYFLSVWVIIHSRNQRNHLNYQTPQQPTQLRIYLHRNVCFTSYEIYSVYFFSSIRAPGVTSYIFRQ